MKYIRALVFLVLTLNFCASLAEDDSVSLSPIRGTNFGETFSTPSLKSTSEGIYFILIDTEGVPNVWRMELDGSNSRRISTLPNIGSFAGGPIPAEFVQIGNRVVFSVFNSIYAYSLTSRDTIELLNFNSLGFSAFGGVEFTKVGNKVFLSVAGLSNDVVETSIWTTSGTLETTQLVRELPFSGDSDSFRTASEFTAYNNKLYFVYDDGLTGEELWVSDGTESGTSLFFDIDTGSCGGGGSPCSSSPDGLTVLNGELIFDTSLAFNLGRSQLWKSDGTVSGTEPFFDLNGAGGEIYLKFNEKLLIASKSDFNLNELWSVGNSSNSSGRLIQLNPINTDTNRSFFESAIAFNDKAYFGFVTPSTDTFQGESYNIWETDGTTQGTQITITKVKPTNAYNISAGNLRAFSSGIVFTEEICVGFQGSDCSSSINFFDGVNSVKSLLSFSNDEVILERDSILTTDEDIFVAVVKDQKLVIYSTSMSEDVNIFPIISFLLDEEDD